MGSSPSSPLASAAVNAPGSASSASSAAAWGSAPGNGSSLCSTSVGCDLPGQGGKIAKLISQLSHVSLKWQKKVFKKSHVCTFLSAPNRFRFQTPTSTTKSRKRWSLHLPSWSSCPSRDFLVCWRCNETSRLTLCFAYHFGPWPPTSWTATTLGRNLSLSLVPKNAKRSSRHPRHAASKSMMLRPFIPFSSRPAPVERQRFILRSMQDIRFAWSSKGVPGTDHFLKRRTKDSQPHKKQSQQSYNIRVWYCVKGQCGRNGFDQ